MAEKFKDNAIFFLIEENIVGTGNRFDSSVVVKQYGDGDGGIACIDALKLHRDSGNGRYYVLAWTLGRGIAVVAECAHGDTQPAYAYYSRDTAQYFAPVIMSRVAEYLDTQARSLSPVPADAIEPEAPADMNEAIQPGREPVQYHADGRPIYTGPNLV